MDTVGHRQRQAGETHAAPARTLAAAHAAGTAMCLASLSGHDDPAWVLLLSAVLTAGTALLLVSRSLTDAAASRIGVGVGLVLVVLVTMVTSDPRGDVLCL